MTNSEEMENPGLQTADCRKLINEFVVAQGLALAKLGEALVMELQRLDRPPSKYLTLVEKAAELRVQPGTVYKAWKEMGGFKQAGSRRILFHNASESPLVVPDADSAIEF